MPERLVVMIAYDGVNLLDIAGPLQAFASATLQAKHNASGYRMMTASEFGGAIRTDPGLMVETLSLDELVLSDIDTLIVPGGAPAKGAFGLEVLIAWLATAAPHVRRICSVCTGAFVLGDAGLLDGKRVTTHWSCSEELGRRHPAIGMEPDRIVINDGQVWTSGGVTAGIDLALGLIDADLGHAIAAATARQLVVFITRPGGQNQFRAPLVLKHDLSPTFTSLHAWIAEHLHEDLRVESLAAKMGKSPRNFARLYAAEVGRTPARVVELMRLEAACQALEETDRSFKMIAADVGLGNEQNLRRVMQRQFGIGPSDYRARFGSQVVLLDRLSS